MFTDKNGNIIDENSPDEHVEGNNPEITGVSTGVGNTETTHNNTLEITDTNDNTQETANDNYTINNNEDTFDVREVHTTHKDEEELHEEPTIHDEQIIEEMNMTNM